MSPQVAVRLAGPVAIIDLGGRITLSEGAGTIRAAVDDAVEAGHRNILLNLDRVAYVDSSGLAEMAAAYIKVANLGGRLKLLHAHSRVEGLLEVTRLNTVLQSFADEETAVASFS